MGKEQVVYWYSIDDEHSWFKLDISKAKASSIYANCCIRESDTITLRYYELITLAVF